MKKNIFTLLAALVIFAGCSNGFISCADNKNTTTAQNTNQPGQFDGQGGPGMQGGPGGFGGQGGPGGFGQSVVITDDGSTTNYIDTTTAAATGVVADDLYENFVADGTVYITLNGTSAEITKVEAKEGVNFSKSDIKISNTENSEEKETVKGVEIQYKDKEENCYKIKYILSGTYTGTVFIKNKSADAAVVLNNVSITSDNGAGPVLRFSSEKRTFIVVPAGTTNTLKDTRLLNQSSTMYDDKKGSVYSKGTLIFTGAESSTKEGGTLNIVNAGYKHAVYTKDYVRVANLTLNITVEGETGRVGGIDIFCRRDKSYFTWNRF